MKRRFDEFVPPDVARPLPSGWYGHLHNIYLHYAAERGLPAMLALVWLLLQTLWDFLRELRKLPPGRDDLRFILHGGVAVVIATMIAGVVRTESWRQRSTHDVSGGGLVRLRRRG